MKKKQLIAFVCVCVFSIVLFSLLNSIVTQTIFWSALYQVLLSIIAAIYTFISNPTIFLTIAIIGLIWVLREKISNWVQYITEFKFGSLEAKFDTSKTQFAKELTAKNTDTGSEENPNEPQAKELETANLAPDTGVDSTKTDNGGVAIVNQNIPQSNLQTYGASGGWLGGYGYDHNSYVKGLVNHLNLDVLFLLIKLQQKGPIKIDDLWDFIFNELNQPNSIPANDFSRFVFSAGFLEIFTSLKGTLYYVTVERDDEDSKNMTFDYTIPPIVFQAITERITRLPEKN